MSAWRVCCLVVGAEEGVLFWFGPDGLGGKRVAGDPARDTGFEAALPVMKWLTPVGNRGGRSSS